MPAGDPPPCRGTRRRRSPIGTRTVSVATEIGTSFVTATRDLDHFEGLLAGLDTVVLPDDDA